MTLPQKYRAPTLRFQLENVILEDVNDRSVYFVRDGKALATGVWVDPEREMVYVALRGELEEGAEYRLLFGKMLRFDNGHLFLKNYFLTFRIQNGHIYTNNGPNGRRGGDFFAPGNKLEFRKILSVRFREDTTEICVTMITTPVRRHPPPAASRVSPAASPSPVPPPKKRRRRQEEPEDGEDTEEDEDSCGEDGDRLIYIETGPGRGCTWPVLLVFAVILLFVLMRCSGS